MVTLDSDSLKINATGFSNDQNIESFEIQVTVKTISGVTGTRTLQIDISSFIQETEELNKRGYNTEPQILTPLETPWRVDLNNTEPVRFKHEIYDIQQDKIEFEWQGIEDLADYAVFTNQRQDGPRREFFIDVDPKMVEEVGIYEFTLLARDELGA